MRRHTDIDKTIGNIENEFPCLSRHDKYTIQKFFFEKNGIYLMMTQWIEHGGTASGADILNSQDELVKHCNTSLSHAGMECGEYNIHIFDKEGNHFKPVIEKIILKKV